MWAHGAWRVDAISVCMHSGCTCVKCTSRAHRGHLGCTFRACMLRVCQGHIEGTLMARRLHVVCTLRARREHVKARALWPLHQYDHTLLSSADGRRPWGRKQTQTAAWIVRLYIIQPNGMMLSLCRLRPHVSSKTLQPALTPTWQCNMYVCQPNITLHTLGIHWHTLAYIRLACLKIRPLLTLHPAAAKHSTVIGTMNMTTPEFSHLISAAAQTSLSRRAPPGEPPVG